MYPRLYNWPYRETTTTVAVAEVGGCFKVNGCNSVTAGLRKSTLYVPYRIYSVGRSLECHDLIARAPIAVPGRNRRLVESQNSAFQGCDYRRCISAGYVTSDNAANNSTMLVEFAHQILRATGMKWDPIECCLNKSPHFNAHEPTAHIPTTTGVDRDEIGLLRAIAAKGCATADPAETTKQMVLDMKVRWSSTFAMLDRGYELRKAVDTFVFEISKVETGKTPEIGRPAAG
ncbi:hypothetical protein C8J57DRAFT_1257852 [Mycena rebaudengoi]|nr:hypothetical protein C8J57DRAFT_1257852 [Mycena rebaudengoi]